jgi:hypothetical protein
MGAVHMERPGIMNGNTVKYPVIYNKPYPDWKGSGADG